MIQLSALPKLLVINFTPSAELDVDYYLIHASQTPGFTPEGSNLINKGPETNISVPVSAAGLWYVRVAAVDTFGEDGLNYSDEYSISVPATDVFDVTPPAVPGVLSTSSVLEGDGSTASITVSWPANAEPDLTGYTLQYRAASSQWPLEIQVTGVTTTLTGLVPGAPYEVRLAAFDGYGNTSAFTVWTAQQAAVQTTTLPAPSGLEVHAGLRKIIVNWASSNIPTLARYEVHLSATPGFTPEPATLIYSGTATLISYDCNPGTTYYVKMRVVDLSGNVSDYTAQVSGSTSPIGTADIAAGAVTADKVATDELITVSAQIGEAIITTAHINDVSAEKITTGTLAADTGITVGADGANQVVIDGGSKSIKVVHSTIERVRLGKLVGGGYGIDIKNAAGESLFTADGSLEGARVKDLTVTDDLAVDGSITVGGTKLTLAGSRLDNEEIQPQVDLALTHIDQYGIYTGTLTGNLFQTEAPVARGVKIDSTGLKAYDSAGVLKSKIDATTGKAEFEDVKVRGDVEANSIKAGTANIIDTLQIKGNAVTLDKLWEFTQVNAGTSWVSVGDFSVALPDVDLTNQAMVITAHSYVDSAGGSNYLAKIRIKKGPTQLSIGGAYAENNWDAGTVGCIAADFGLTRNTTVTYTVEVCTVGATGYFHEIKVLAKLGIR